MVENGNTALADFVYRDPAQFTSGGPNLMKQVQASTGGGSHGGTVGGYGSNNAPAPAAGMSGPASGPYSRRRGIYGNGTYPTRGAGDPGSGLDIQVQQPPPPTSGPVSSSPSAGSAPGWAGRFVTGSGGRFLAYPNQGNIPGAPMGSTAGNNGGYAGQCGEYGCTQIDQTYVPANVVPSDGLATSASANAASVGSPLPAHTTSQVAAPALPSGAGMGQWSPSVGMPTGCGPYAQPQNGGAPPATVPVPTNGGGVIQTSPGISVGPRPLAPTAAVANPIPMVSASPGFSPLWWLLAAAGMFWLVASTEPHKRAGRFGG